MSERAWTQDDIDDQLIDDAGDGEDWDVGDECGRWLNGELSSQCSKAGSEECDWFCPIGLPRHRPRKRKASLLDLMEDGEQ
jgi:hypothetical protein